MTRRSSPLSAWLTIAGLVALPGCGGSAPPETAAAPTNRQGKPDRVASPAPALDGASAPSPQPGAPDPNRLNTELIPFFRMIEENKTGPARVRIRKHLAEHPEDGQAKFLFGLSYHREKRYAQALPYYEKAILDSPDFPALHYFMGWSLFYSGESQRARAAWERQLALTPDEPDAHFGIGLVALEEDDLDEAEKRFRRALELDAGRSERARELAKAHARLGDVLIARGDFDDARREFEQAIALWSDHYEAHYKLSRVRARLGDEEGSAAAYATFVEIRQRLRPGTAFPE